MTQRYIKHVIDSYETENEENTEADRGSNLKGTSEKITIGAGYGLGTGFHFHNNVSKFILNNAIKIHVTIIQSLRL